jgi:ribosome biogenesis protein Nip4
MIDITKELEEFMKKFGLALPENLLIIKKEIFLVPKEVKESIDQMNIQPESAGLPLGELKKNGFRPSFALLDLCKESDNKISINKEAEWLFTCGRDVFMNNIIRQGKLKTVFLVTNTKGEVLGLGKKEGTGKQAIIKNLLDRGDFLRREKN